MSASTHPSDALDHDPNEGQLSKPSKRVKPDRTRLQLVTREVTVVGVTPLMFDRYPGDNKTQLEWHQKIYLGADGKSVVFPAENIMSFLSGHNTLSAPKRLLDSRKYKAVADACLSFVSIGPEQIPLLRDGKPIEFGQVTGNHDPLSGIWWHRSVARLEKGIPNPKERPVLPLPWSLKFSVTIMPNEEIQEQMILMLFEKGGYAVGFGTYRGVYGKFYVDQWD